MGRLVGDRVVDAIERRLDVVGGHVALAHCLDDGRAAERAVARREDLGVAGAHIRIARDHAATLHHAALVELVAHGLLAHGGHDHVAGHLVVRAFDDFELQAALIVEAAAHRLDNVKD